MTLERAMALLRESQGALNQATLIEDRRRLDRHQSELTGALSLCAAAAETGYLEASLNLELMEETIASAREQLDPSWGSEPDQVLEQLQAAVAAMTAAHEDALIEIEDNRERLGTFNITIFGRTLAGKSTLMEILTRGDGSSIGRGAQRTTRDIRTYEWSEMRVSDIPGVAAYDGAEDERLAHRAAERADLIVYLITDDGPQPAEAEHLAVLRNTGVAVLGICNVKRGVGDERQRRLFLRTQERVFEPGRLADIIAEFQRMTDRHGAGPPVVFRSAHLEARRLADRPECEDIRTELMLASRFGGVEDHILNEVSVNGAFHRTGSFLRSSGQATLNIWEQMLVASHAACQMRDRLRDRVRETESWRQQVGRQATQRIGSVLNETIGTLRREINAFAEDHCEDREISEKWKRKVEQARIESRVQEAQKELHQACADRAQSLAAEVEQELASLAMRFEVPGIAAGPIRDHRRIWNWSIQGVSAGLGLTALASYAGLALPFVANPITLPLVLGAAVLVGLGLLVGRLFGNRAKRRQEAIGRIVPKLQQHLNEIQSQVRRDFDRWVERDLTGGIIAELIRQLEEAAHNADCSAEFYGQQSEALNRQLMNLNQRLLSVVLAHAGAAERDTDGMIVARVPGRMLAIRSARGFDPDLADTVGQILQEDVVCLPREWTDREIIGWAVGNESEIIIDGGCRVARARFDAEDPTARVRVRIAQQITNLHIGNEH
ncbi:MAG: GTPase domain-containing protein [Chloroflexi bacterium]|nr:GTPase domain-containing protein [Chloroflexota bacterium]